ncbi:glycosyltransferase, partial [Nocardiopsis quinghaiensis]|uniref:glycosyltransferase n=1 Tax=Nocardiopsis quinghaiensis TaxID=464995 RepID=UPI001CC248F5
VATLPPAERERLEPLPPNVRAVEFAPLHALAATCSAVINHGGWGTFLCSLSFGVPQVVVPTWFDNVLPARRLEAAGAGLHVPPEQADGHSVLRAVTRLLEDPSHTAGTRRIRTEMESSPSPNRIASRIREITERHRHA